jgi:hypothetical protein
MTPLAIARIELEKWTANCISESLRFEPEQRDLEWAAKLQLDAMESWIREIVREEVQPPHTICIEYTASVSAWALLMNKASCAALL